MSDPLKLSFEQGSVVISHPPEGVVPPLMVYDQRTKQYRIEGRGYRDLVLQLHQSGAAYQDTARDWAPLNCELKQQLNPRPHQEKALAAWKEERRGVVCLPTGAGKTFLAVMAIGVISRPTLIVVPTIDLIGQWREVLGSFFDMPIGQLGGGIRDLQAITVSTYDSARTIVESQGNRFAFLIFDECHHLPAAQNQLIALAAIAPYRLGLSATPERSDGGEDVLYDLVGPLVYREEIQGLVGSVLAPYDVVQVEVALTEGELAEYKEQRAKYIDFLRRTGIRMGDPQGWTQFIKVASRSRQGREALKAFRSQKRLAQTAEGKIHAVWDILVQHNLDSTIIFTEDNQMAYRIGCELLLPVITHRTHADDRKQLLESFRQGEIRTLVTSKVLNEGVDVPEARVGIIVSGSGAVREHVQRLGRILRQSPGKRAVLYEIIAQDTNEHYVNERRRQHNAYQRSS